MDKPIDNVASSFNELWLGALRFDASQRDNLYSKATELEIDLDLAPSGKSPFRFTEFLAGRIVLSLLLKEMKIDGCPEVDPQYGFIRIVERVGKARANVYANISHSSHFAVAVIGQEPVGVDVESLDRPVGEAVQRVAAPEELKGPSPSSVTGASIASPLAVWTAKEAFLKAIGLGIRTALTGTKIDFAKPPPIYPIITDITGPFAVSRPAVLFDVIEDSLVAVCASETVLGRGLRKIMFNPFHSSIPEAGQ